MTNPQASPEVEQVVANTESILKSVCGTARTGRANTCDHDHSAQARGLVLAVYDSIVADVRAELAKENA